MGENCPGRQWTTTGALGNATRPSKSRRDQRGGCWSRRPVSQEFGCPPWRLCRRLGLPWLDLFERGDLFVSETVKDGVLPSHRAEDMDRERSRGPLSAKNLTGVGPADASFGR